MRAFDKKKIHALMVKQYVKEGKVNNHYGQWVPNQGKTSMDRDIKAGHKA